MNARASENYLAISRSFSASKSVEIFWAEIYWGRLSFYNFKEVQNNKVNKLVIDSTITNSCTFYDVCLFFQYLFTLKSVEIFWAEIYWGRLFFRVESSLIQSSCRSFIGVIVPYEISKVNIRVETKILVSMSEEI
jgi:hypothetical protein